MWVPGAVWTSAHTRYSLLRERSPLMPTHATGYRAPTDYQLPQTTLVHGTEGRTTSLTPDTMPHKARLQRSPLESPLVPSLAACDTTTDQPRGSPNRRSRIPFDHRSPPDCSLRDASRVPLRTAHVAISRWRHPKLWPTGSEPNFVKMNTHEVPQHFEYPS